MTVEVDVRDLVREPGASRLLEMDSPIEGLATELARVDREVHAELLFESVVEGILVSGSVRGTMRLSCARCLKRVESPFDLHVQELFASEADEDEYPLEEGFVDLEPMIRDAVVLAMPFAPLCRPECLGLCSRCGGDLNLGECACPAETDERWAPLIGLEWGSDSRELQPNRREEN
jgi:uncharacterized protein